MPSTRPQHHELGAELHQPAVVARRELEIGNRRIGRRVGIERERQARPRSFSYAPASPNSIPAANGSRLSISSRSTLGGRPAPSGPAQGIGLR